MSTNTEVLANINTFAPTTVNDFADSQSATTAVAREEFKNLIDKNSNKLTEKEQFYLSNIANVGNAQHMRRASVKMCDDNLFFSDDSKEQEKLLGRRASLQKSRSKLERLSSQRRLSVVSNRSKSTMHNQLWRAHQETGISLGDNGSKRKSMVIRRSSLLASSVIPGNSRRSSMQRASTSLLNRKLNARGSSIVKQNSMNSQGYNISMKQSVMFHSILASASDNIVEEDEEFLIEQAVSCFGESSALSPPPILIDEKESAEVPPTPTQEGVRSRPLMMRQASQGVGVEISFGIQSAPLDRSFSSLNTSRSRRFSRMSSILPILKKRSSSFDDLATLDKTDEKMMDDVTFNDDTSIDSSHNAWLALDDRDCIGYGGGGEEELDFLILGTDGNDEASKPHVLSPPLMDSLFGFLPYSVTEQNYWLKFSLVRDGASLMTKLQQIRGSKHTLIAIETVDGDVFGSFTSDTWKKTNSYYGSGEAFLWKMKQNRLTSACTSILDQAVLESELEVYPWSGRNYMVQFCQQNRIGLGGGSIKVADTTGGVEDVGNFGLALEDSLLNGSSGPCATFNNPCLAPSSPNGVFEVANLEVWTLTPYVTEKDAEKNEFAKLFMMDNLQKQ